MAANALFPFIVPPFDLFTLFFFTHQARHQADAAGEGPRPHGAAGGGRRPAGVQSAGRGDGGDDRGAPGQSAGAADGERAAETAPPGVQTAAVHLAEADAVQPRPAARQHGAEEDARRLVSSDSTEKYVTGALMSRY